MRNAKRSSRARSAGFALQDLLFTVTIVSVLVGIGASLYSGIRDNVGAEDQAQRMVDLASDIRRVMGKASGDYTGMTPARAYNLGLIKAPMTWDGTNVRDRWGNVMDIYGFGPLNFDVLAGGGGGMTASDCATLATKLASTAFVVRIGAGVTINKTSGLEGTMSGGNVYKSGDTITQTSLTSGCAEANTVVAARFIER